MSYTTQKEHYSDTDFQQRVGQAARKCAIDIANEATATPQHAARKAFAHAVLSGGGSELLLARAVVADDVDYRTNTTATGDTALYNRLSAIWNALANDQPVA